MKNIVKEIAKKIAYWVLSEEIFEEIHQRKIAEEEFQSEIQRLLEDKVTLEFENDDLRELLTVKRKVLVSQPMLRCIIKMLPDANAVARGQVTPEDLGLRTMNLMETMDGQNFIHKLKFIQSIGNETEGIKGLTIHISNYNMNVFIPLRREKVKYEVYNVKTEIDTYFWDFYMSGIRMLSSEAWDLSTSFIRAQRNVLKEFKESGLL